MVDNPKIKLLIVDDSFFMRKLVRELVSTDKMIDVIGEAGDGAEAVRLAADLEPDVITMDYHLPKLNGAEATNKILQNSKLKRLPAIIMLSAYARPETDETFACLRAGAIDYILKPSGELSLDIEKTKDEILTKIHVASRAKVFKHTPVKKVKIIKNKEKKSFDGHVVVIGASTGGPPLVEKILSDLPANFSAPVVVAQHMPDFFISRFASRLNKIVGNLEVDVAVDKLILKPGQVALAPAEKMLDLEASEGLEKNVIMKTSDARDYDGPKPSINYVFRSAARNFGNKVVAVILSGMGEDGRVGAEEIKKAGGYVIAQDPETAAVGSMPERVIESGMCDEVLPPSKIGKRLTELVAKL